MKKITEEEKIAKAFNVMEKKYSNTPLMLSRQKVPSWFDGLSPKTLANLESQGKGPPSFKRGRTRFYLFEDLVNFITNNQ
jgi:hypothetical protein